MTDDTLTIITHFYHALAFAGKKTMTFTVSCECGKSLIVHAGDAGTKKICACGARVAIPSLSVLRESENVNSSEEKPSQQSTSPLMIFGIAFAAIFVVGIYATPLLVPLGLLMIVAARLWLAMQILAEMSLPNAMTVFLIPFMPTVFLFKRFDIAWKPFLFGIAGYVVTTIGFAATGP